MLELTPTDADLTAWKELTLPNAYIAEYTDHSCTLPSISLGIFAQDMTELHAACDELANDTNFFNNCNNAIYDYDGWASA